MRRGLAALTLVFLAGCGGPPSSTPDILLITIDTLRADRLGSYGYSGGLTPHMDRLAKGGVLYEQVQAPIPVTLPSHITPRCLDARDRISGLQRGHDASHKYHEIVFPSPWSWSVS